MGVDYYDEADLGELEKYRTNRSPLKESGLQFSQNDGSPEISLQFNDEGAGLFEEITARIIGKPIAIFLMVIPLARQLLIVVLVGHG